MYRHFLFAACCLLVAAQLTAQHLTPPTVTLHLEDVEHIRIAAGGGIDLRLTPDDRLSLTPPDIAQIPIGRLSEFETDTLVGPTKPARCVSRGTVDTLFINGTLFLTDVPVEVAFFTDGTYEGESTFGIQLLTQAGRHGSPQGVRGDGAMLRIEKPAPQYLTNKGRWLQLQNLDLSEQPNFPLQPGNIWEIRLIRCNQSPQAEQRLQEAFNLFKQQEVFCQDPTEDPTVPPSEAVARIQTPITVRYFEGEHAQRAEALADCLAYLFLVPRNQIAVEDMLPSYNGVSPEDDYLEVWFR